MFTFFPILCPLMVLVFQFPPLDVFLNFSSCLKIITSFWGVELVLFCCVVGEFPSPKQLWFSFLCVLLRVTLDEVRLFCCLVLLRNFLSPFFLLNLLSTLSSITGATHNTNTMENNILFPPYPILFSCILSDLPEHVMCIYHYSNHILVLVLGYTIKYIKCSPSVLSLKQPSHLLLDEAHPLYLLGESSGVLSVRECEWRWSLRGDLSLKENPDM